MSERLWDWLGGGGAIQAIVIADKQWGREVA